MRRHIIEVSGNLNSASLQNVQSATTIVDFPIQIRALTHCPKNFAIMTDVEYRKLGRFHIDKPVAQGGMGEIIRSVDDQGRAVALKTILPELQSNPKLR